MDMSKAFDVLIVGAGIAGASVAAELAPALRVGVLEQESQPGFHSTGRSAAAFAEHHRAGAIRVLSRASRGFYEKPLPGFDAPLLRSRGYLFVARDEQLDQLEALHRLPEMRSAARWLSAEQARERMPLLRPGYAAGAVLDESAADIEVHAVHQGYLKVLRRHGGALHCNARVTAIERRDAVWRVTAGDVTFTAPLLVNAAGAWADRVAALAGTASVGLQPLRRTAALVEVPLDPDMDVWPMTLDVGNEFYFKPDAGCLLISPADETPSEPGDVVPDDFDLAVAVDRIERATTLDVRRIRSRWAGLRSFVPDRNPVAGFAADAPGFYWLAGQGGTGIQIAPALARFAAAQLLGRGMPLDLQALGLDPQVLSPARLSGVSA